MKGMQKISRGSGFKGVLNYAFDRHQNEEQTKGILVGGNMGGSDISELTKEFSRFSSQRRDIEKPVWHNSLRVPKGETLSDEKWNEIGFEYMRRMGFDEHKNQFCFVRHDDDHIHIIANRVDITGNVWLGRNENIMSTRIIAGLEKDYGLTITKNLEYLQNAEGEWQIAPGQDTGNRKHKHALKQERDIQTAGYLKDDNKKAYFKSVKIDLMNIVQSTAEKAEFKSVVAFADELEKAGVTVKPVIKKDKNQETNLVGFSLEYQGMSFKGSEVKCSLKQLQERGIDYDRQRDKEAFTSRKRESSQDRNSRLEGANDASFQGSKNTIREGSRTERSPSKITGELRALAENRDTEPARRTSGITAQLKAIADGRNNIRVGTNNVCDGELHNDNDVENAKPSPNTNHTATSQKVDETWTPDQGLSERLSKEQLERIKKEEDEYLSQTPGPKEQSIEDKEAQEFEDYINKHAKEALAKIDRRSVHVSSNDNDLTLG